MEFFGINFGALFQNPVTLIGYLVGSVLGLPVLTLLLDHLTQYISDGMLMLNRQVIMKIPITPIRDWLKNQLLEMLDRSIKRQQDVYDKVKNNK